MVCPRPTDAELDINPAAWAAEVLAHPLAPILPESTRDLLSAIAAEAPWMRPADAHHVIWLAVDGIDAEAIRLGLEARA